MTTVDISKMTSKEISQEKRRILKNIILISVAFLFNFNAFQGLSRLQSTLNLEGSIGVVTSSVIYATLVISCFFLPKLVINFISYKWTIALSFLGYIAYMAANGYPTWGTLVTASVLVGLCAAPLWTAQCAYFTIIAGRYAEISGITKEAAVSRFFGIFFFFFQLSGITGSIISATILRPTPINGSLDDYLPSEEDLQQCGVYDCGNTSSPALRGPDTVTRWTMVGVYIGIAFLAVLLVGIFVDRLPKDLVVKRANVCSEIGGLLAATAKHLAVPAQLILIPLTMYSGFEQASFNAEFAKSFVACSLGIWSVGLVTIPYGVVNAIISFVSGHVIKYTGRIPVFVAAFVVDLCIQITLMTWLPRPEKAYVLYILASMWGFTDGIWQTQINTLYGTIFGANSEAAFSNYRMWESFGFIIAFAYSGFICTNIKLYILISVLILGMIGYFIVEYMERKKNKEDGSTDNDKNDVKDTKDFATNGEKNHIGVNGESNPSFINEEQYTKL